MLRKIFLIISPLLILTGIFFVLLFLASRNSGKGALQVTTLPSSKVYLDGKLIGQTPLCLCQPSQMLKTGDYTLRLDPEKEGISVFEQKIQINPNVLTAVDRSFDGASSSQGSVISLKSLGDDKKIELLIVSTPNKAQVFLDNSPVGTTPISLKNITASDHDIRLSKDGYIDKIVKVKTVNGYRLEAIVFMGINSKLLEESPVASSSAKLRIIDTPTGFLRVRESSSVSSKEIGQVKPGEEYEIIEEAKDWYKIKLAEDLEGWVSSNYAEKID